VEEEIHQIGMKDEELGQELAMSEETDEDLQEPRVFAKQGE
jgi:hypothetical protein